MKFVLKRPHWQQYNKQIVRGPTQGRKTRFKEVNAIVWVRAGDGNQGLKPDLLLVQWYSYKWISCFAGVGENHRGTPRWLSRLKCPTFDLSSGLELRVVRPSPVSGSAMGMEPA